MKKTHLIVFLLFLFTFLPWIAFAQDLSPDYQRSITLSRQHADSPTGWVPDPAAGDKQIITITGTPATENAAFGLKYDSAYGDGKNYLIVRTLANSKYYPNNYVNESGYYIKGGPATTNAAWVTTGNDATKFLQQNEGSSANIVKLLERGLGMNNDGSHTAIVEYAVIADNDHILRPTKNPNIKEYLTTPGTYGTNASFAAKPSDMTQATYDKYIGTDAQKGYYQYWKEKTYDSAVSSSNAFPWTQIGYTFFWGNGEPLANIQGMSEFIIPGETSVQIYGIYSPQSYIYTLNKGGAFSTDSDAQYGNGFAGFKVTGACDTIWAGHRFQRETLTDTVQIDRKLGVNKIEITTDGSISGGQGLLIWSLNYAVDNQGTISGATANKFATTDTANIAVLFKGDTTAYGGVAAPTGSNTLTNSGTISSPGIAVMAEAGDTYITNKSGGLLTGDSVAVQIGKAGAADAVKGIIDNTGTIKSSGTAIKADRGDNTITNNPGGVISGGNYAIQTGAGNDTVTVKGGEINGNVDLGTGTDKVDVTAGSNAKFNFTLNKDTTTSAQTIKAQTVNIADNTKLAVTMTGNRNIRNNDKYQIVNASTLTVNPANLTIQNDNPLPMVTLAAEQGQEGNNLYLYIVASRNNSYYKSNSGNASLGALLDSLANTATGDFANVLSDLDNSGNAGDARKMEPTVDRGVVQAGFATNAQVTRTIINRMVEFRAAGLGAGESGISTGDEPAKWGVWTQGFGTYMKQAAAGSSNGYTANIWGGSMGFDRLVYNNVLVGLSGSYARNNIGTADVNTRTNADSYQGNFYGSLARDAYYMNGILSYAYNRYDASRHIAFGTTNRIATSNYGGQQYSAYAEGGYGFKKSGFDITPLLSLQYMRLHINDYAESGADSLNLNVDAQRYNMFQSGLGAKLAYPIVGKDLRFIPEVHAKWLYDFVGDSQQASSTFTGGGASFATQGFDPPKSSYNLGATLTVMTAHNVTLTLNYDFEMKTDFYSHNGYFNLRYVF